MGLRFSPIVLALLAPALAAAQASTRWDCAYAPSEGEAIVCQLLAAPVEGPPPQALPASYARLPRLVSDIRNAPQTLDGKAIVIPLHSIPIDMARAELLARSILCGSRAGCEVRFTAERTGLVEATVRTPARSARPRR